MIEKVYILGLGAVGSVYASMLFEMDPDCVEIIASKERIERYKKSGVTVNGKLYPFNYNQPVQTAFPETSQRPADLIIIAVKQHHLRQAINDIRGFVGEDTIILSLLNGITSEEIIGQEYGMDKLLYSFCVGTDAVREGRNTEYTKTGKIVFGENTNTEYSGKVKMVKEFFDKAQIPYEIPENMIRQLWWKFMMNVGINQVSAVLKAPYGVFRKVGEARALMEMACREVVNLSAYTGINLNDDDIKTSIEIIDTLSAEGKTSMLQDVEAGRKTEVELFAGTVIELGRKYGIATPVNDVLFKMICSLEKMYNL
ncbi:MAG TPA: ketopantoate reductase family protein [Clostridiales bacterium]|nr:ketopantoate reductase family protein [Clostridiales bacterium]